MSATLPLALYFEPEEIALSSLCIAAREFRMHIPFPSQCRTNNFDELFPQSSKKKEAMIRAMENKTGE